MFDTFENIKERKQDRILVLKVMDGVKPKTGTGLVDPRLFSGDNELHCIQDKTSLWYFKYKFGGIPEPLKQRFTTFDEALRHATKYFKSRNVLVESVLD